MAAGTQRLDRFIAKQRNISRGDTRLMLAQKRLHIDGELAISAAQLIDNFSHIQLDGKTLQQNTAQYIMLNKPTGVVSATTDNKHHTVIDLLDGSNTAKLHIVGRLDLNSTGLLLLTNDSRWSERVMQPENKIKKRYTVTLSQPVTEAMITTFDEGIYFAFEHITTKPAQLSIIDACKAEVVLTEGKYHQIKRMFGHFQNKVLTLHRTQVGNLCLDTQLAPGQSRALTAQEVSSITHH